MDDATGQTCPGRRDSLVATKRLAELPAAYATASATAKDAAVRQDQEHKQLADGCIQDVQVERHSMRGLADGNRFDTRQALGDKFPASSPVQRPKNAAVVSAKDGKRTVGG